MTPFAPLYTLQNKVEHITSWIEAQWIPTHPEHQWIVVRASGHVVNHRVLERFDRELALWDDYCFSETEREYCPIVPRLFDFYGGQSGAYLFHFVKPATGEKLDVLVVASFFPGIGEIHVQACVPQTHMGTWWEFQNECGRIANSFNPEQRVHVVGGQISSFVPSVDWEDIILPHDLKQEIFDDVSAFFTRGTTVYRRLKLKPFRKLLLAGPPGTGKTMLCTALAKWALDQGYVVIYVSSVMYGFGNFTLIVQALQTAAQSKHPCLILLEEFDAYLHEQQKAMVLNVLDGNEAVISEHGVLMIATTNYPEAIDERVLKRPGRLDRIFIIPPLAREADAERILRQYLGEFWQDDHIALVPKLVGYPGSFVREIAVHALMQSMLADEKTDLPLDVLMHSFDTLREQIEARDLFVAQYRPTDSTGYMDYDDE